MDLTQVPKLITHEDGRFGHIHKLLGMACLAHFGYRIHANYARPGEFCGLYESFATVPLVLLHAALHITSFQFILSPKRVKAYNIIWPEMRVHSLIFAYRSVAATLAHYAAAALEWPAVYLRAANIIFVYLTMIAADATTAIFRARGQTSPTTIRGNPFPDWTPPWIRWAINRFYSLSQVIGTMNILYGTIDQAFMVLMPIQIAPFAMTLVRKGIMRSEGWHVLYLASILANFAIASRELIDKVIILVWVFLRFQFGVDKYVLWTVAILARAWAEGGIDVWAA